MKTMKTMSLLCVLFVLLSACQEGYLRSNSMAVDTRSTSDISDNDFIGIKADLVAKTLWFLERMQSTGDYSQIDTAGFSSMKNLYLIVRPVYTLDSLTFVNWTEKQDVLQELDRDPNYQCCFLCRDKQVLNYALYEWQEQTGWQCAGCLNPRKDDQRNVNVFLDNLILTHDELFVYLRPAFVDKNIHSGSGQKWAKRFMERIVYQNSEKQFVYFTFRARATDSNGKVVMEERVLERDFASSINEAAESIRNPRMFMVD